MIDFDRLKAGSVVVVRGEFGSGPAVRATIENVEQDVKNGQPGIDYVDSKGEGYWAYAKQIVRVVEY